MLAPCLHAGPPPMHDVYLVSLRKCATPPLWLCLGSCVVLSVLVLELVVACGPCLRASWEALCSSLRPGVYPAMAVVPSITRFLCLVVFVVPWSLGRCHSELKVDIDAVLIRTFRALRDLL
jgi:hypothetical protein